MNIDGETIDIDFVGFHNDRGASARNSVPP